MDKRPWYGLALRHLRMARRLLLSGFADGAVFHLYHAYECAISAFIAAHGYQVPPEGMTQMLLPSGRAIKAYPSPSGMIREPSAHKARIMFFDELLDQSKPYYATYAQLRRFFGMKDRMDALYYDQVRMQLPHQKYNTAYAAGLYTSIAQFAHAVWTDIK